RERGASRAKQDGRMACGLYAGRVNRDDGPAGQLEVGQALIEVPEVSRLSRDTLNVFISFPREPRGLAVQRFSIVTQQPFDLRPLGRYQRRPDGLHDSLVCAAGEQDVEARGHRVAGPGLELDLVSHRSTEGS